MERSSAWAEKDDIVNQAKHHLQFTWVRMPKCGIHETSTCHCREEFYDTYALRRWMDEKEDQRLQCNAERLINAIELTKPPPFGRKSVLQGDDRSILVLGYLLSKSQEELLYLFCNAGINDNTLANITSASYEKLKENLKVYSRYNSFQIEMIIDQFKRSKWAFCPAEFHEFRCDPSKPLKEQQFSMARRLPFVDLAEINHKGGTACVIKVSIQEHFLSKEMGKCLKQTAYHHERYGKCYQLAIKSYSRGRIKDYIRERTAFDGLRTLQGVLRCFGSYSHRDGLYGNEVTYNLILELGTMDLYDWMRKIDSPQRTEEILESYRAVRKIADAVRQIHQYEHECDKYHGWHGDIKPDNILRVNDEWKLADFGFAEFESADSGFSETELAGQQLTPTTKIRGGTMTYGAPDSGSKKSQKIDIWSFGCVLSVVATWIVKGLRGVKEFENHRMTACLKHRTQSHLEVTSDAFHDGNNVYPDIKDWHDHLNEVMRKSDIITPAILALVDDHMLKQHSEDRLSSAELCHELDRIISEAESMLKRATKPGAHNHVKESLLMTEKRLVPNSVKTDESALIFKLPDPSQDGHYLRIYAQQPSETGPTSKTARMRRGEEHTLSVAHRESTLRKSVDVRTTAEESTTEEMRKVAVKPQWTVEQQPFPSKFPHGTTGKRHISHDSKLSEGEATELQLQNSNPPREPVMIITSPSLPSLSQPAGTSIGRDSVSLASERSRNGSSRSNLEDQQDQDQNSARNSSVASWSPSREQFWAAINDGTPSAQAIVGVRLKADPGIAKARKTYCRTPIMEAAAQFKLLIVGELIDYSDVEQTDSAGQTVLHILVATLAQRRPSRDDYIGFLKAFERLCSKDLGGEKLINRLDKSGNTPLSLCVISEDKKMIDIIKAFLAAGAWIRPPPGVDGNDILLKAVMKGPFDVVDNLIKEKGLCGLDREAVKMNLVSSAQTRHLLKDEWKKQGGKSEKISEKKLEGKLEAKSTKKSIFPFLKN